jgi:hypothetical protein
MPLSALYAADWYASPAGKPTNSGTAESPWDLATALADNTVPANKNSLIKPGDTVWLLAGTYGTGAGTFFGCSLTGTESQPITVRQVAGQRAIINGSISVYGAWSSLWGFEITNTNADRKVDAQYRPGGVNFYSPYHKAINLVIHDVGHPGIGIWTSSAPAAAGARQQGLPTRLRCMEYSFGGMAFTTLVILHIPTAGREGPEFTRRIGTGGCA